MSGRASDWPVRLQLVSQEPFPAREGEEAVAYLLRPTRIEDVFAHARRGEVLPQKTTYFFPKLISGLLFHPL